MTMMGMLVVRIVMAMLMVIVQEVVALKVAEQRIVC